MPGLRAAGAQIINPNLWQPLSIYNAKTGVNVTQKFTTPQWLNVTSFALTCGTEFLAPAADIYQYGSLGYVAQARRCLLGQSRSGCLHGIGGSFGAGTHRVHSTSICLARACIALLVPDRVACTHRCRTQTPCAAWLALTKWSERQANELLAVSAALYDNTKVVVEYWADPTGSQTPPGHWARVCEFISQRDNHTLDDVRALARTTCMSVALCLGLQLNLLLCMRDCFQAVRHGQRAPHGIRH